MNQSERIAALSQEIARLTAANNRLSNDLARSRKRIANLQKQRNELRDKLFDQTLAKVTARHRNLSAKVTRP
ncbi:hypothetical protein [Nocardia nova]|uniref:hypothetical protein n=1 Tax=Nocardia nova TaxID=37330 RepID=UPI002738CD96|nr:hypothetical protein [Nocardia nova]